MMKPADPTCPDCDLKMEEGFLLDETHGGRHPVYWVGDGAPEKSFWMGTKLRGRTLWHTQTYRCAACGLLKTYAREEK